MNYTPRLARYNRASADSHEDMLARIKRHLLHVGVSSATLTSLTVEDGYEGEPTSARQPDAWRVTVGLHGDPPTRMYTRANHPDAPVLDESGADIDEELH